MNLCDGSGWHSEERTDGTRGSWRCECLERRIAAGRVERAAGNARIPRKYEKTRTFETYDRAKMPDAFDAAKRWADSPKGWLLLIGAPGVGKTHLACAAVNVIEARREPVAFVSVPTMLESLRPDREGALELDQLARVPVLALDDIGKQKDSDWTKEVFFRLFDLRYMEDLPTLITSNDDGQAMAKKLGSAIVDRMIEKSDVVTMGGRSYRKQIADQRKLGIEPAPWRP